MSPRQMLRAWEVRAPENPPRLGTQTDPQVRRYPDASGAEPVGATMQEHLDIVASRIRLNAGAADWRDPPVSAGEGGGAAAQVYNEVLEGDRDDVNRAFSTVYAFYPQTLRVYFNGVRQALGDDSDFTASESRGRGTGYDRIDFAYAPGPQDSITADYTRDTTTAGDG